MNIIRGHRKNAEAEPADGVGSGTVGRRSAMNNLREGLGPEFAGFEIEALTPKRLARKHLFDDLTADQAAQQPARSGRRASDAGRAPAVRPGCDRSARSRPSTPGRPPTWSKTR
jgi:hypothetical protein